MQAPSHRNSVQILRSKVPKLTFLSKWNKKDQDLIVGKLKAFCDSPHIKQGKIIFLMEEEYKLTPAQTIELCNWYEQNKKVEDAERLEALRMNQDSELWTRTGYGSVRQMSSGKWIVRTDKGDLIHQKFNTKAEALEHVKSLNHNMAVKTIVSNTVTNAENAETPNSIDTNNPNVFNYTNGVNIRKIQ
eukprot:UN31382